MKRHCSVCGLPGHTKAIHKRRNLDAFTDSSGVVHPIAGTAGYSSAEGQRKAKDRDKTGMTTWQQQLVKRDPGMSVLAQQRRLENIDVERREARDYINKHPLKTLLPLVDKAKGRIETIPYSTWNRLLPGGRSARTYSTSRTKGSTGERGSLRWEYTLDDAARHLGYDQAEALRDDIHDLSRERDKLKKLDAEYQGTKENVRGAKRVASQMQRMAKADIAAKRKARKPKARKVKAKK